MLKTRQRLVWQVQKHVPLAAAAAPKPGLKPRTALRDIWNKASEQLQITLPL